MLAALLGARAISETLRPQVSVFGYPGGLLFFFSM